MGAFFNSAIAWSTLGLISIPIIIHLINRRRFRQIDWAAMEFLLEALRRNRRRLRIEQLILLLLRIALMALLGLAFARPVVSEGGLEWLAGALRSEEKVFLLDDSFSTTHRQANRTSFQREVEAITNALDHLADRPGADRVTIIQGSRYETPITRSSFVDAEQAALLSRRIATLSPSDGRLPLADALAGLADRQVDDGDTLARPRVISILTDLRATDWTDGSGGPDPAVHSALRRLTENEDAPSRILLLDVAGEETSNLAVTDVRVEGGGPVLGIPAQFRVQVDNFGAVDARGLRLSMRYAPVLQASTQSQAWVHVTGPQLEPLPGGERATYSIPCTFRNTGPHAVEVELTGANDTLPADDSCAVAVKVVDAFEVLLVNGEPSSERFEGETDFLEAALSPSGDLSSGVRSEIVVEDNLPRDGLERYSAVFLCNLFSVPEDFITRLKRYVEDGGSLIVFLGDQVDAALYNRRLGPSGTPVATNESQTSRSQETQSDSSSNPVKRAEREDGRGLLPGRIGTLTNRQDQPSTLSPGLDHPYFRSLRDIDEAFSTVSFNHYFSIDPVPGAQVIARYADTEETPAIIEHAFGKGRVILFSSSADFEWTDWPRSPTFLILLQDLVSALVTTRSTDAYLYAGTPLEVPLDIARYDQEAKLRTPDYPASPERTLIAAPQGSPAVSVSAPPGAGGPDAGHRGDGGESSFRVVTDATHRAGHYALGLRTRGGEDEWRLFAFRRQPEESDLTRISAADLNQLYPEIELTVVKDSTGFSDVGRGRFEVADFLLFLFLFVLFVEGFLAWRFAHHRGTSRDDISKTATISKKATV